MTPPSPVERILCSRTESLPPAWRPDGGSVPLSSTSLQTTLAELDPLWIDRPSAEADEGFLQWIPYALVFDPLGRVAAYPRQGSEARLHGLWSLGLGGHVNTADLPSPPPPLTHLWPALLLAGLRRELDEEYPGLQPARIRFLGLIHERRTAVGRVHLGAVHRIDLASAPGQPGPELAGLLWLDPTAIGHGEWPAERFETWSIYALNLCRQAKPEPA